MMLDSDETLFGVESTIIDLTSRPPTLLKPGQITPEDLKRVLRVGVEIPPSVKGFSEAELT